MQKRKNYHNAARYHKRALMCLILATILAFLGGCELEYRAIEKISQEQGISMPQAQIEFYARKNAH